MWCIGHQSAVWSEQCAREVQTFLNGSIQSVNFSRINLNVRRNRCSLQRGAHLLGDGHEPMAEDGQLDGIHVRTDALPPDVVQLNLHVAFAGDERAAVRLNEDCAEERIASVQERTGGRTPASERQGRSLF